MNRVNLIVVLNKSCDKVLMCHRTTDPYKGQYNFVGGKVEKDESISDAGYRELYEETNISRDDIELYHMMNYQYLFDNLEMNIFYGVLNKEVELISEKHPLHWFDVHENFMDVKFAGDGNTHHMLHCAIHYINEKRA